MRNKTQKIFLVLIVFAALLSFFTIAHPLFLFDSDDWGYAVYHRRAIPNLYEWNPTRILPEILYPLCAKIAAYIVYPFNNDFVKALNIVSGIVLSALIVAYLYLFYRVCTKVLKADTRTSLMISLLFLISHFALLDSEKVSGNYLFWAHNLSCVYYYTIPSLLNACLMFLYLITKYDENRKKEVGKIYLGVILMLIYLAINSNLYQSAILAIYIFSDSLFSLIINRTNIKKWFDENKYHMIFLIIWFMSVIFESRGPRSKASWLGVSNSLSANLMPSFRYLAKMIAGINKFYLPLILLACGTIVYALIRKEWEKLLIVMKLFTAIVIYFIFLVLINAKVSPDYNSRMDVTFGLWFYIAFLISTCIIMLIDNCRKLIIFIPLIMLVLTNECVGNIPGYSEYNITNLKSGTIYEIDQYIVSSIIEASENDISEITIRVPQFSSDPESNWPLSIGICQGISNTLYAYNVISRKVDVTTVPDKSLNEKYGVQIEE